VSDNVVQRFETDIHTYSSGCLKHSTEYLHLIMLTEETIKYEECQHLCRPAV